MAAIGRPHYINIKSDDSENTRFDLVAAKQKGIAMLDHAYAAGIRYFDTAPGYGFAEEILTDWLQHAQDETIHVTTKWGYSYEAGYRKDAAIHEIKEHSIEKLDAQWSHSKKLLPYLKVYQIHSATFESGVLENDSILHRLAQLRDQFRIQIGLTTTCADQVAVIRKAMSIQINHTDMFDAYQVTYNILDNSLSKVVDQLHQRGKKIIIKEALANGRLFPNQLYPQYIGLYDQLAQLAGKYRVGIDAIVINYCQHQISPYKILSGASNQIHLKQNLLSTSFDLNEEEIELLNQFYIKPEIYWAERKQLKWN